jgi:hypothetical protein
MTLSKPKEVPREILNYNPAKMCYRTYKPKMFLIVFDIKAPKLPRIMEHSDVI